MNYKRFVPNLRFFESALPVALFVPYLACCYA